MKKVLVTGASGFVGRQCLPVLLAGGYRVHAVCFGDRFDSPPEIEWHDLDLLDPQQVSGLMARLRPDYLLHCAWYAVPGKYWTSAENLRWLQAGVELLKVFVTYGGQRVVMVGTCAEYDWNYGYCSEKLTPLAPATLYGICKHALQAVLHSYAQQNGISAAWGRLFFLYGPYEHPDRLVSSVIRHLLSGKHARCSRGTQIRDFLHVSDAAAAVVALLESDVRGPVNVASGRPVTVRCVIESIAEMLGRVSLVEFGAIPTPASEPPVLFADVTRLNGEVGWTPSYDLDSGLQDTVKWWERRLQPGSSTPA